MVPTFLKNNAREEVFLALDIGTEVIKALVCTTDPESGNGQVLGVGRVFQNRGNMRSGAISNIEGVIGSARTAIQEAQHMAGVGRISSTVMGLAGELVKGTTTTVHYERARPEERIALPELRSIIQKVQWKAYERIKKQISWELGHDVDVRLINAAIVDVRIDGYRVTNPLNFQGKSVSVSVFNAYAPMIHLGAIDTIAEALELDLLSVAAEPYAVSASVGYEDITDFSGIFIDVGGGTTDVAVVRNGGLEGTKMFALGGRAFTKRIAAELRIPVTQAEETKLSYARGTLDAATTAQVAEVMKQDTDVWLGGVELALMEFAESDLLPSNIYLCGGGSGLPEISAALSSSEWTEHLPFAKTPRVGYLQPRDVVHMEDHTGQLTTPQDVTPLALANLLVDVRDEERVLAQILKRAMRSAQDE